MNEQIIEREIIETVPCVIVSEKHYNSLMASIKKHRKINVILILGGIGWFVYRLCKNNDKLRAANSELKDENETLKIQMSKGK